VPPPQCLRRIILVPQEAAYIRQEARQQFRASQNLTSAEDVAKAVCGILPAPCSPCSLLAALH
jgi:hypothetical protein